MDNELFKKLKNIKEKDSFMIAITIVNKKKKPNKDIDAFLIVNKFPYRKLEGAKKNIIKLINQARKNK